MTSTRKLSLFLPNMRGGGAERVALRLAKDFLEAGHEVDVVLMKAEGALLSLLPQQAGIVDLGVDRIRDAIIPFARYLRKRRPHAVQVFMWPLTVAGIIGHRLVRSSARLITSDHAALSKHYPNRAQQRLLGLTVRLFYPLADARVIVAHAAADDLARLSNIDRRTLEVIYNPVDAPSGDLQGSSEIERLWGDAERRIITVGTLKAQKNHALLIRAFASRFRGSKVKLMLVGDGPLRSELQALARERGVDDQILFAGFTTDPWPYYASAHLFALSSDYEGYPLVLIEALRCGLPIVSTDCESGPREILDQGKFGILVPVGDEAALGEAIKVALDRGWYKDRLRERAESLSGTAVSERYLELMLGS